MAHTAVTRDILRHSSPRNTTQVDRILSSGVAARANDAFLLKDDADSKDDADAADVDLTAAVFLPSAARAAGTAGGTPTATNVVSMSGVNR